MHITILMSIWCQNLWDELILKNEVKLLKEKYWESTIFSVFTYDLENIFFDDKNIKYLEYFPIWIRNPKNIFRNIKNYLNFVKTIKKSDKIVIGWGWIIFDNETGNYSNPLNQWLFRVNFAKILKKEIIFFWVSVDIKDEKNYLKVKNIFSPASEIFVRDENSFKFLKNLWIKSEIILDPVFSENWQVWLENYKKNFMVKKLDAKSFSLQDLENIDFSWKNVWLALRGWYLGNVKLEMWNEKLNNNVVDDYNRSEEKIINDIIDFILEKWAKVVLLPHSFHLIDKQANDYEFLKLFLRDWVIIAKNMQETYEYYKEDKIDFCLSMRLHSMILSQVYGINFIGLKYSKKWDLM